MQYSQAVLDRYYQPSFAGSMDGADPNVSTHQVGTPDNGEVVRIQMKIIDQQIVAICFKAQGSCATIAAAQLVCEQLLNQDQSAVKQLSPEKMVQILMLPKIKIHSVLLAIDACLGCIHS